MGRAIPTFLKISQDTGAAPPNTDNYYIMPEHSFVTMKTAVESVYTKLFSDWSIFYLPGNPTSSTWRQNQYLFSVRSLLKQKEWTYESNLLVRNQLYDWYIHRQGLMLMLLVQ